MSLILEALRKLDREKDAPQRGVLVLATVTAPDRRRRLPIVGLLALAGLVALAGATVLALRGNRPGKTPAAAVSSAAIASDDVVATARGPGSRPPTPGADANAQGPSEGHLPAMTTPRTEPVAPNPAPRLAEARVPADTARSKAVEPAAAPPLAQSTPRAPSAAAGRTEAPLSLQPAPEALVLEAIAERDGERIAVLSGRLVREGDVFGATRVVRIGASEVEIETAGERRVLRF